MSTSQIIAAMTQKDLTYQIEIINQQDQFEIETTSLNQIAEEVLREQKISNASLNVMLVDNPSIHEINNNYLQHDFPTDVITFPFKEISVSSKERSIEGDIVISVEMANEVSRTIDWPMEHELSLYLIHGILHLCGYDDLDEQAQKMMRQEEHTMLRHVGLEVNSDDSRWKEENNPS